MFHLSEVLLVDAKGHEAWHTLKRQEKITRVVMEVPQPCAIFCLALMHYAWITYLQPKRFYWFTCKSEVNYYNCVCAKGKKANKNMKPRILQIWQPFPCEISGGTSRGNSLMVCVLRFVGLSCYGSRPGELLVMCSCAKHFTFAVRLATKDYKLVPATC